MRNFTKIFCVFFSILMVVSLAACSFTQQYSYKTDDTELPIGVYIYNLYSAYNQAQSFAQQSDKYDSEAGTYDGQKSFLKMEITDDDKKTATADEWILEKADEYTKNILAVYHEFNELGCTIDEATESGYKAQAQEYWDHGPYYQYGEQYANPYSDIFEPLGVGFDSFYIATFYTSAMQEKVFDALYGATGTQAVSDKELTDFFTKNYVSYKFFNVNLYTTESQATKDEEGNDTTEDVDVPLSDNEIQDYKAAFGNYANDINGGASFDDVVKEYMDKYSVENDPSQSGVEVLDDSSIGENIVKKLKELKDGSADTLVIGDETDDSASDVLYLIYREPIENQISAYIEDTAQRETVLQKMKQDDLTDFLDEVAGSLGITKSSAVGGYTPKRIEDLTK